MNTVLQTFHPETFAKLLFVIKNILRGLERGQKVNKRDLYYQNVNNFRGQRELDSMVMRIVSALRIPRYFLGIVATSKGLVAGNLRFSNQEGVITDCGLTQVSGRSSTQKLNMLDVRSFIDI